MPIGQRSYKRLWISFAFVMIASFAVLGGFAFRIASLAPPIPETVRTPDGTVLFEGDLIREGQNVWQSLGASKSAPFGATALASPRIGPLIICTVSWCSRLIAGPRRRERPNSPTCPPRTRPPFALA